MFTWSVTNGVQGPCGQGHVPHRHGASVNAHTGSMCTLGWLDVFTGISTQASDGETMLRRGLVRSLLPGPGHALCPDPVPGGRSQPSRTTRAGVGSSK